MDIPNINSRLTYLYTLYVSTYKKGNGWLLNHPITSLRLSQYSIDAWYRQLMLV
jgi:hypothetical protein